MEFLQYRFLESLKDRVVMSSQYQSKLQVLRAIPHVDVSRNEQPDLTKTTQDRFNISEL